MMDAQTRGAEPVPGLFVTVAVLLIASMTVMANATIAPSLPGLKDHFSTTPGIETLLGLILTLPSAAIVLTAGIFGWLADRVDRRPLLILSAGLYAVGGASGLWAETLPQLLVGRAILGLGVAGTMTLGMVWATDLWHGAARARFMGLQGAAMSGGGIVVVLLGGALATLHWRGAFAVYLLSIPVAAVATRALAPYNRQRAETRAERRAAPKPDDAFPWGAYAFVGSLAFLFMAVFYVMPTRLPFRLAEIGVTNSLQVGMVMACMTLAAIPGSLSYGRLRRHLSALSVFALSYGMMGAGMFVISQASGLGMVIAGTLLAGAGMGPSMPNFSTYFMSFVPPAVRGRASGLLTTAFFAGQFASPLVSAPLVAAYGLAGGISVMSMLMLAIAAALFLIAMRRPEAATRSENA